MMNITIAEVLHYAADHMLSTKEEYDSHNSKTHRYSCNAAEGAVWHLLKNSSCDDEYEIIKRIRAGLSNMGVDTDSLLQFFEVDPKKRQGARYMWLKFAAMIAEEQGV